MTKKFFSVVLAIAMIALPVVATAQQGPLDPTKQWMTADNVSALGLGSVGDGCGAALTTGAFAANPANSGALSAPSIVRAQAQNNVYQVTTSAAASALTLTCDIVPPGIRSTPGKGVSITGLSVYYGVQTSALTSVTSPNPLSTITLPATPGAAAAGTVAAIAAPTVVFSPLLASAQLTITTSGQCFRQDIIFSAPLLVNLPTQRIIFEEIFNQTVASATVYQICGVDVYYNNIVF